VRLDLVVGSGGAGKATSSSSCSRPLRAGVTFVNADVIAAARWPDDPSGHAYEAARGEADTRDSSTR